MSKLEEGKTYKKIEAKKCKTKFLAELEILKQDPLYSKALDEVIQIEKRHTLVQCYEIYFSVKYATIFGEKVAVVGGHDALGNWDPSKAVEMYWNEGNIWKCKVSIKEAFSDFQFKYVCLLGTFVKWEQGINRNLSSSGERIDNKVKIVRDDVWNS